MSEALARVVQSIEAAAGYAVVHQGDGVVVIEAYNGLSVIVTAYDETPGAVIPHQVLHTWRAANPPVWDVKHYVQYFLAEYAGGF